MTDLRPCAECSRHVAIDERVCPFCNAQLAKGTPHSRGLGRVSRAAAFAGVALASTACGGKKKPDTIDNTQQQAATPDAGTEQQKARGPGDPDPNQPNVPMPYGAPPARKRIV